MRRGIIKPLLETVKSSVCSGVLVFDLTRVVEELIFNSLDAGATKVSVAVDVGTGYIKVTDNASGVTRDGLMLLGERYATSKSDQLADMDTTKGSFGFRGEALGSISDVSLLEIVTKAQGRPNGYRKVIKGCKCLYLGIDDARHDVGTTVIVRDLFYNQPVRRKQMQSSPRKILHSLKECILKIALVHLKANFKVFDIESGDELLHAHPSPLPLLMSCFGLEAKDLLHEFDVSDGLLKISGYISGPCETFSGRWFSMSADINSRFVCKGPIHKLSQLAETFDGFGRCNDNKGFDSGKRSRVQNSPCYILNLGCPLSLYDLTFEPSKTSVEFKDWGHVLTFLEKAITKIWNKCLSYWHYLSDADALRNDKTWKGDTSITSEEDYAKKRKRRKVQFLDLPSPKPKVPTEFEHLSPSKRSKVSCLKLSKVTKKLEKHQEETGFTCQTNYSASCDGVFSLSRETLDKENRCHLETPDVEVCFTEDYFLANNFSTERSSKHMDCITGTRCNNMLLKVDTNMTVIPTASGSPTHCFRINNDFEAIRDTLKEKRSFLKSCSSRRDILPHGSCSVSNEEFDYKCNGFGNRELWVDQVDKINVGVADDSNQTCESWKDERASVWCSPVSRNQNDMFMAPDTTARDPLQFVQMVGECSNDDSDLPLSSVNHFEKCPSRRSFLKSVWSCMTPDNSAKTKLMEADRLIDQDACENRRIASCQYSADKEEEDYIFGFDKIPYNFGHLNCFASSCMERSGLDDYSCSGGDICKFYIDNINYNRSPINFDIHSDQAKWLCRESSNRDNSMGEAASSHRILSTTILFENKDQGGKINTHTKTYENRQRRSHSAPPFYKGKKKFSLFNSCSEAESTQLASTHDPLFLKGTTVEHDKQSSAVQQLSSEPCFLNDSLNNIRPDTKTADIHTFQTCEMQTGSEHSHANLLSDDSTSKKIQVTRDLLASEIKWRSSCQMTTNGENSHNLEDKVETVLDMSSGILHLAGDTLVPKSINKDCFEGAKVLQQVDRKYIPVVGGGVLVFVDQVLSGEMKTVTYLDIEQELVLPEFGHQLLQNYADIIRNWGWICNIHTQSSKSFTKNMKLLHCQPSSATLIAVPCILGVSLTDADLLEFLQQLADTDGSSTVPPSVFRVLNFKACRGAIMFGEVLLPSECSLIVEELNQTLLCFQCAHGRPTTAPLVNLELLHKQISKLGLDSTGSNGLWQGLCRQKVSLERAVECSRASKSVQTPLTKNHYNLSIRVSCITKQL